MAKDNSELLGKYDVKKLLIKLSIPAILGMMVNALYNLVDTLFIAISEGEAAIGALAFAFPVQMILMAIGLMIGIGSASVFSRAFGRKDYEKMDSTVNTALRIDFIGAAIFAILGYVFLEELLYFFEATEDNIHYAKDYLSIIVVGLVPLSLSMVLNNLTRAEGRAIMAMIAMSLGAGLNIILDPIFIFGFDMGVRGAAYATVISQVISFAFIFAQTFFTKSILNINLKRLFHFDVETVKDIIVIGLPTFFRNSIGAFLAIFIFKLIGYYVADPTLYISVYGVINRITFFIFMPGFGLVQGLTPIVGFNYGAKNFDRLISAVKFATKLVMLYFIFGFIAVQLFGDLLFDVFSKDNNEFFMTYGSKTFNIISIGFLMVGFQIILSALYQAVGFPKRALLVALSRQFIFFVPTALILTAILGLDGIWITFAISDLLSGGISMIVLFYELRSFKKKESI